MAERKKRKGSRRSQHEWQTLLAKLDGSDLGVDAFCRREAISAASLYRWRTLLSDGSDGGKAVISNRAPAFVDLGALNSASSSRPRIELTLDLGDGLTLHLVRH
jgi:hypothetical protein